MGVRGIAIKPIQIVSRLAPAQSQKREHTSSGRLQDTERFYKAQESLDSALFGSQLDDNTVFADVHDLSTELISKGADRVQVLVLQPQSFAGR